MLNFLNFYTYEHLKFHAQLSMKKSFITSGPGSNPASSITLHSVKKGSIAHSPFVIYQPPLAILGASVA